MGAPPLRTAWPLAALAGIGALDLVQAARHWPVPVAGALDEPAHLLTAALLLGALPGRRSRALTAWAFVGSVAIDVDHLPLYLWHVGAVSPGGRPVTHSLATCVLLAAAAGLARGRVRTALAGLAVGVGLHLVRDLGTGPGAPLGWPLTAAEVRVPYAVYLGVLVLAAGTALLRRTAGGVLSPTGDGGRAAAG